MKKSNSYKCQICLTNRQTKFSTKRIEICQWCIADLKKNYITKRELNTILWNIAEKFIDMPLMPQEPKPYKSYEARIMAMDDIKKKFPEQHKPEEPIPYDVLKEKIKSQIRNDKSLSERIFGFFRQQNFENEVEKTTRKQFTQNQMAHQKQMAQYAALNSEIENALEIKYQHYAKLLKERYSDELKEYERNIEIYKERAKNKIRAKQMEIINEIFIPKNFLSINKKQLRAYKLMLLNDNYTVSMREEGDSWNNLKISVINQDGFKCHLCDREYTELHLHHIIPISNFGTNHLNNLVLLCHRCHNEQHDNSVTRHSPRQRTGGEFVSLSLNTTKKNNNIIELSACKFRDGAFKLFFHEPINPGEDFCLENIAHTNINIEELRGSSSFKDIADDFISFIGESKLVVHYKPFHIKILRNALLHCGHKIDNEIVDVWSLSKEKLPSLDSYSLSSLVRHFNLKSQSLRSAKDKSYAIACVYINCLRMAKGGGKQGMTLFRG